MQSLVLASQSPRRRILLECLGIPFRVENPATKELTDHPKGTAALVQENAQKKALAVALREGEIAIGADTVVALEGTVLGKPENGEAARRMLQQLSGKTHQVLTGLALVAKGKPPQLSVHTSEVRFREIGPHEVELYLQTGEPFDKAGAYAIQGRGAIFVTAISGSYTNVMGLGLEGLLQELQRLTGKSILEWGHGNA